MKSACRKKIQNVATTTTKHKQPNNKQKNIELTIFWNGEFTVWNKTYPGQIQTQDSCRSSRIRCLQTMCAEDA